MIKVAPEARKYLSKSIHAEFQDITPLPPSMQKGNCCQPIALAQALDLSFEEALARCSWKGWEAKTCRVSAITQILLEEGWKYHIISEDPFFRGVALNDRWQFQNCFAPLAVLNGNDGFTGHVACLYDGKIYDRNHSGAFWLTGIYLPPETKES